MTAAWESVLERVAADSRVAWTAFHGARPLSLTQGVLAVAVSEPGQVRAIAQRGHDERLRQALIDVLGLDVTIDVVHDPGAAPKPANSTRSAGTAPASEGGPPAATAGRSAPRGAQLVREAKAEPQEAPDEPSDDDPDLGAGDGMALIARELGARPIGEIDHS